MGLGGVEGMGASMLGRCLGRWMQTWTDNEASVLRFTGGTAEDVAPTFEGAPFYQPAGPATGQPDDMDRHHRRCLRLALAGLGR